MESAKEKYKSAYREVRIFMHEPSTTAYSFAFWLAHEFGERAARAAYESYMQSFESDSYAVPFRFRCMKIPF